MQLLLDYNIFNFKQNFSANFVLNIAIESILYTNLINLCKQKKFSDFFRYNIYFFNQAPFFNRVSLGGISFLDFIYNEYIEKIFFKFIEMKKG